MKVYLAARWMKQAEMRQIRNWLLTRSVTEVTSRWIDAERDADPTPEFFMEHGAEHARQDFEDIERADVLILDKTSTGRRAGYMVEFGYALALRKKTIVIGQADCVFTQLANAQFNSWNDFFNNIDVCGYSIEHLLAGEPKQSPFTCGNRHPETTEKTPNDTHDPVSRPAHYTHGKIEVWDAITNWKLDYLLGNVVKYVARAAHKNNFLEDLKKAKAYLEKKIGEVEK